MTAYLDESLRTSAQGLYVVAAVVVTDDPDATRLAARRMLLPRQRRFHWRDEDGPRRAAMLDCLVDLDVGVMGYVRRPVERPRQERARALCLNRLLWDLGQRGIDELVVESRHEASNQRDRLTIMRAQKAGIAPKALTYGFEFPSAEPLLWFADAAAGAVAATMAGELDYVERLGARINIVEVGP